MYGLGFKPGRGRPPSQMIHNEKISIINQKKSATSTSYGTRSYFFYEGKSQMAKNIHLQMWKTVAIWCEKLFVIWISFGKNTAYCKEEVHVRKVVQLTPVFAIEEEQIEHILQFCC